MNNEKRKLEKYTLFGIMIGMVLALLLFMDINKELSKVYLYVNLKSNVKFIVKAISTSLPVIFMLIMFIVYKLLNQRLVFRVEKLNLGGLNIIFDNPNKVFKQQVKNFLNTKRTLFKIEIDKDNFYETINSYYSVYSFLREEIKVFDTKSSEESPSYIQANIMLKELNIFLTSHQNNFKRWYEYIIENRDKNHDREISDIQKEYRNYAIMVEDFKKLNRSFCNAAKEFEIDITKWDNN